MRVSVSILLLIGCAAAALSPAQVQGVVTGYAIDSRIGALRPILGLPGASRLGNPIRLPLRIAGGEVRYGRAVVISAGAQTDRDLLHRRAGGFAAGNASAGRVYLINSLSATPQTTLLDAAIVPVSRVFLSAGSTAALLYSAESGRFQFASKLDATPQLSAPFSINPQSGAFSAAAVAEAGNDTCALLGFNDGSSGEVQRVCASGAAPSTIALLPQAQIASLALLHQDRDGVLADRAGNQIVLLPNLGLGWTPVILAGAADGISAPDAVFPVNDATIAVSQSGSSNLLLLDSAHRLPVKSLSLSGIPAFLKGLDAAGVIESTGISPGPMLLIDARNDFQSFFVPMN